MPTNTNESSIHTPWSQLAVALIQQVLSSRMLGLRFKEIVSDLMVGFEGVPGLMPTHEAFTNLLKESIPDGYRSLIELCRTVAEGLQPDGAVPSTAFLLPMSRTFEQYVTRGIRSSFAEELGSVSTQPWYRLRSESRSTPVIAFCPDVTIDRAGRPHLNIQLRWAKPPRDGLITADVHRALAYTAALGVRRSVLIYPSSRDQSWEYDIPCGPATLEIRTLCVTGDVARCRLSLHRLGRHLHRLWSVKSGT